MNDGNLASIVGTYQKAENRMHIPRNTITRELLETINNNRPNFGRVLSLSIAEACANIERLTRDFVQSVHYKYVAE